MAILATLDFDGLGEAAAISLSAPWATNGVKPVATSAAAVHGDRGARWASTATAGRITYDMGADQTAARVWSWYMTIRDSSPQNCYIAGVLSLVTGGSSQGDIRINPDHTVSLRNGGTQVALSTRTLSEDTPYRFEWRIHQSAGTQELRVYEGESATLFFTISGGWTGANTRVFYIGPNIAAPDGALDYDTVRLADDWTGPFAPIGNPNLALVDFNALSENQTVTTASLSDAAWEVVSTSTVPIAQAAAARHGIRGVLIPEADASASFKWHEASTTATRVMSFYFRLLVAPAASTYLAILSDNGVNRADWRINADRTVTLRNAQVAIGGASPEALALHTWYRAEWMTSTSGQELRIFEGESATPYLTRTAALTNNLHTRMSWGITSSPSGHSLYIDTLRVTESWAGSYGAPVDPQPEPATNTHFYVTTSGVLRPFRLQRAGAVSPPEEFPFWIGHHDRQTFRNPPYPATFEGFEAALANAVGGYSGPMTSFVRGYSGSNFPSTFGASSVASAATIAASTPSGTFGAMLNVKRSDWAGLASGAYDSTIISFFNSWPTNVYGSFTINHEPENDGPSPATPSNSAYVSWASVNGPIWSQGIARTIAVAAPIIRARGLDVKIGGCLMDFSWDTTRWQYWDWWNYVDPQYFDVTEFQLDAYTKTVAGSPPQAHDPMPRLAQSTSHARAVGIQHFSLFETANDRRLRNGGDTIVGNDESVAVFWENYFPALKAQIPETRMVCYFSTPSGPASAQAGIAGRGLEVFGNACLNARRP